MSSSVFPPALGIHFDQLCAAETADAWSQLGKDQEELRRAAGLRYPTALAGRFLNEIARRAEMIERVTKQAHTDFRHPLAQEILDELLDMARRTFEQQANALEEPFQRELTRAGHPFAESPGRFQQQRAASTVGLANALRQHFWMLQNVPAMMPTPAPAATPVATAHTVNISGTTSIGNLAIAGEHAIAAGGSARQWNEAGARELSAALDRLAAAIETSAEVHNPQELIAEVEEARQRLRGRTLIATLKALSGLGTAVQSVAAVKPAWDAVKAAAHALGLAL